MEKLNFEKTTIKKLLWFFIIVSIFPLLLSSNILFSYIALTVGTFLGYFRLFAIGKLTNNILFKHENENNIFFTMFYLLALFVLYATIALSAVWGLEFFVFFTIGALMINTVVYISAIFELLGSFRKSYKEGEV